MDIQSHKRTLGIIHLVYGSLIAVIFIFVGSLISLVHPFIAEEIGQEVGNGGDEIILLLSSVIRMVFVLLFIFSALPSIVAGIGLIQGKGWAMVLALIAGCASIFSFPFGTAVGIYSIYVFVEYSKNKNEQNQK